MPEIHIPDGVEELCEACFSECKTLSYVTFGESSSLRLIGKEAFHDVIETVSMLWRNPFCGVALRKTVVNTQRLHDNTSRLSEPYVGENYLVSDARFRKTVPLMAAHILECSSHTCA